MPEPIRVLQVFHGMDCGGAENMIMNLYRHMDRTKVQFDFLVHTNNKCFFDDEIEALGGRIFHAPYYKVINTLSYQKFLHSFFRDHPEIHIVHGHLGSCAHVYLDIAKKHGCYTIAHSHATNPTKKSLKNLLYSFFTLKTRRTADYFMACSKYAGLCRFGKNIVESNSFFVLKNAIDLKQYEYNEQIRNQLRTTLDLKNCFVVGHIGRFSYPKNHEFLIKVFFEVQKKQPNSILLLVGDGVLRKEIEKKVADIGISNSVIFTGIRSDVSQLLQAMDCFVFPSHFEGLGIVAIEAQAAGLPCVCSDVLPEESKVTELFVPMSLGCSYKDWASKILSFCKNYKRESKIEIIKATGYDITETATILNHFYLERGNV